MEEVKLSKVRGIALEQIGSPGHPQMVDGNGGASRRPKLYA